MITRIKLLEIKQRQLIDRTGSIRRAVHRRIVHQYEYSIGTRVHVHLQHIHSEFDGMLESHQSVAGAQPIPTLVGNDHRLGNIKVGRGLDGGACRCSDYDDEHHHDEYEHPVAAFTAHDSERSRLLRDELRACAAEELRSSVL